MNLKNLKNASGRCTKKEISSQEREIKTLCMMWGGRRGIKKTVSLVWESCPQTKDNQVQKSVCEPNCYSPTKQCSIRHESPNTAAKPSLLIACYLKRTPHGSQCLLTHVVPSVESSHTEYQEIHKHKKGNKWEEEKKQKPPAGMLRLAVKLQRGGWRRLDPKHEWLDTL